MGDKKGPDPVHRQTQPLHPFFRFPAGDPGIDQDSLFRIAHIVTVAVTARIQGCDE
jgi:hypothetical protein